ncbi:MAG TPA: hypothetical protein VFI02_15245 [Armatimonadota bacterium]|nr:hypothetical protein [Armatimonadota bacterium]
MQIDPLLVITVVFVIILVGIILLIATKMEKRKRKLSVTLPEGWHHVPGASPLEYRPEGEGGGVLQISLNPPFKQKITSGEEAEKKLIELNDALSMRKDLGERIALGHEQAVPGIMATATYESDDHWYSFWLIPTEVTILGTYIVSKPDKSQENRAQAAEIMRTVEFR